MRFACPRLLLPQRFLPSLHPQLACLACPWAELGSLHAPPSPHLQVVLERNTRNKKKCITTVSGLDAFGIKLGEASKLFGERGHSRAVDAVTCWND